MGIILSTLLWLVLCLRENLNLIADLFLEGFGLVCVLYYNFLHVFQIVRDLLYFFNQLGNLLILLRTLLDHLLTNFNL